MNKPIICIDFDGVIHSYSSGWKGADVIPDPPVPGAIAWLREAINHFEVHIYSSRSGQPGGLSAMWQWVGQWVAKERLSDDEDLAWCSSLKWPTEKPAALITIDDRALTFDGQWFSPRWHPAELLKFKPWNKREPQIEARPGFKAELEHLINRYSMENGSDTPDFILAAYLARVMAAFDVTLQERERWYGRNPKAVQKLDAPEGPTAA